MIKSYFYCISSCFKAYRSFKNQFLIGIIFPYQVILRGTKYIAIGFADVNFIGFSGVAGTHITEISEAGKQTGRTQFFCGINALRQNRGAGEFKNLLRLESAPGYCLLVFFHTGIIISYGRSSGIFFAGVGDDLVGIQINVGAICFCITGFRMHGGKGNTFIAQVANNGVSCYRILQQASLFSIIYFIPAYHGFILFVSAENNLIGCTGNCFYSEV